MSRIYFLAGLAALSFTACDGEDFVESPVVVEEEAEAEEEIQFDPVEKQAEEFSSVSDSLGRFLVTANRLNRRTCPSEECGVIGQMYKDQAVEVYEYRSRWVRISGYYDAYCMNGKTAYVIKGSSDCKDANGIAGGKFAEWVSKEFLSPDTE